MYSFVGYRSNVNHRLYKALVCISLVLTLASTGVCAVSAHHTRNVSCERSKSFDHVILAAPSGFCQVLPCDLKMKSPFLLTNSSTRQIKNENRKTSLRSDSMTIPGNHLGLSDPWATLAVQEPPLSFYPPPLFYLHCSIIR